MSKKKAMHAGVKWLLLAVQHIAVLVGAVSLITVISNMFVADKIEYQYRTYHFDMFEHAESFEKTTLFSDMVRNHVDNVVTNVVIGSQIGENGRYDGNYLIDITSFADRKNPSSAPGIVVEYRLADLLKWYNHGLIYTIESYDSSDEFIKRFGYDLGEGKYIELTMLSEMFLPVDGIPLKERAHDYDEYWKMVSDLEQSIYDLGYNVSFYNARKDKFAAENTNLRYCFGVVDEDGRQKIFSNADVNAGNAEEYFKNLGAYAIYDLNTLSFETNMIEFTAAFLQSELNSHNYVYEKASFAYVGIDTDYKANDVYAMAKERYNTVQNLWYYIGAGAISFMIWLVLFSYLSVMAGRKKEKDGNIIIEPSWIDYIPIELYTIIFAGVCAIVFLGSWLVIEETEFLFFDKNGRTLRIGLMGLILFTSAWCSVFWYSVVRRFKLHIVLKNSLCGMLFGALWRLCKKVFGKVKIIVMNCYDNAGTITRIVIPMLVVNLINLFGGFVAFYYFNYGRTIGLLTVFIVLLIDVIFVYMVMKADLCRKNIVRGIIRIRDGEMDYQLDTTEMHGENRKLAEAVNSIGIGIKKAVETSMKDERLKTDLITNVSHDIKTPLTSIINYVDLLKRENIQTEPVKGYIEVLDAKSQRLKQLTDDLVEASKISSGNIVLNMGRIKLKELLMQSVGEFSEKFEQKNLTVIENYTEEDVYINADPARMWRVVENLFNNIFKYSLEGTRVYVDLTKIPDGKKNKVILSIKNISKNPLKVKPEDLTERFIRGDESRTTEGSGLGLSIAQNLMELQGGKLNILLDGDLFKTLLTFDEAIEVLNTETE